MAWLGALIFLYFALLIAVAWISLHPVRLPQYLSPGSFEIPFEEIAFASGEVTLRGWWLPQAAPPSLVLVFAHGYVMNRCEMLPEAAVLWRRGAACLLFDQRAHGRSAGGRSGIGTREAADVRAAVRWARERAPGAKIVLVGSSMGAAACAFAMAEAPELVDGAILDSAYGRLPRAILGWWRFLGGRRLAAVFAPTVWVAAPFAGFNPYRVDVADALARIGPTPILMFHGSRDTLAEAEEAKRNFAAIRGPKRLVWFEGYGHCEGRWFRAGEYHAAVLGFLQEIGVDLTPHRMQD